MRSTRSPSACLQEIRPLGRSSSSLVERGLVDAVLGWVVVPSGKESLVVSASDGEGQHRSSARDHL